MKKVHIEPFIAFDEQESRLGNHIWSVARLVSLAKGLPVLDIPLAHLNVYYSYDNLTLRDMVMHMNAVNSANLKYPIILDQDGEIMDGRHRVMKAMLNGLHTIKAVRFDVNPHPCRYKEN